MPGLIVITRKILTDLYWPPSGRPTFLSKEILASQGLTAIGLVSIDDDNSLKNTVYNFIGIYNVEGAQANAQVMVCGYSKLWKAAQNLGRKYSPLGGSQDSSTCSPITSNLYPIF